MEVAFAVLRIVLALVLLAAGAAKLWSGGHGFVSAVAAYRLLPAPVVRASARVIPLVEIACGGWLLSGHLAAPAALTAATLLTAFTVAVLVALSRGQRNDCGCGLPGSGRIGRAVVTRNLGLIAALVLVAAPNIVGGGR